MFRRFATVLAWWGCAVTAKAQDAVAITAEPHHHQTYADARLRVFRVEVPAHDSTLLHEHAVDYFWIAVGASTFRNAVAGKAETQVTAPDGSVHFTRGGFAHVARIEGASAFHNVTLELLHQQLNPRNLCEQVLPVLGSDCARPTRRARAEYPGTSPRPAFETDELRVTVLTIRPHATVRIASFVNPPLLVTVDGLGGTVRCEGTTPPSTSALRSGDVVTLPKSEACSIRISGNTPSRFLALDFINALP